MTVAAYSVIVSGRVQGVYFRALGKEAADRGGAAGWIRNLPDGRVEAFVQGTPGQVEPFLAYCRVGPPAGHVASCEIAEAAPTPGMEGFHIRR